MALRRSFEEIEQVSVRLRQKLGIDALLCPDLLLVLERKLASVFPGFQFIRMPDAELPEAPAKADCVAKTITVRESIAQQAIYGSGYARMTSGSRNRPHRSRAFRDSISQSGCERASRSNSGRQTRGGGGQEVCSSISCADAPHPKLQVSRRNTR